MPITLIRSNKDNTIHGADNDRKTGCGIRLQGNSGYSREGELTDITDLTCDRCKEVFATKMIRESNREELKLAREERKRFARAKKQGIVSESTYEEYVLKREAEASAKRDSKVQPSTSALPPLKADMPDNTISNQYTQPAAPYAQPTAPYAQPAAPYAQPTVQYPEQSVESSNQYQAYQPQQPEIKVPNPKMTSAADDDFLSQFIIKKETATEESAPVSAPKPFNAANNIISAADDILSQFETETEIETKTENDSSEASAPVTGDASSFYSNQIPLVEAEYVSSHDIDTSSNSEFGTISTKKSSSKNDDLVVPEVPELTPTYQSYSRESISSQTTFSSQIPPENKQNTDSSFDSIAVPDLSDMDTILSGQSSSHQSSVQYDSLSNEQSLTSDFSVLQNNQEAYTSSPVSEFTDMPLTQPQNYQEPYSPSPVSGFTDIPSIQPQGNQEAYSASPVSGFTDIPSIQPQDNQTIYAPPVSEFANVSTSQQPPVSEFISIVPPTNEFVSAVPPVISNVQSTTDEFTAVSSASGFTTPNQFIVPPSMQQDAVSAAPYASYQQQSMYNNSVSSQNTYTSTPIESQPNIASFANSFAQNYSSAAQSYNSINNVNNDILQNQMQNNQSQYLNNSQYSNPSAGNTPVLNEQDNIKKKSISVLFNPQNNTPMVDSIEEALRQLGAGAGATDDKNKASEKEEIVPDYVPYVPSSSKTLYNAPPVNDHSSQPKRVVSAKDAKKLAKIDAKFHKELVERGFSPSEFKNQRRGK